MRRDPVLVVGTTPDYVLKIHRKYPEDTVFIADTSFQTDSLLRTIEESALLFASLENFAETLQSVCQYLSINKLSPRGIACFDCESLIAASKLALHLKVPFPAPHAVAKTRNKFESRRIWKDAGLPSPHAALASELEETLEFFHCIKKDIVLKPVSGSGGELLFHCKDEEEIIRAVRAMKEELPKRRLKPLFRAISVNSGVNLIDPCSSWIVEEFISGPEFSCDFILRNGQTVILRETGKVKAPDQTFGSILAYTFPPLYPEGFVLKDLHNMLKDASTSLGFTWGYFMADFIITDSGHPVIIELTPRPGGDSIPDLVEIATGNDLLGTYLDIVSGKYSPLETSDMPPESFASINLYAPGEGVITCLDPSRILSLPWVKAVFLKKKVGDKIILPPDDYDNRLLGYCVISPESGSNLISIYHQLNKSLRISIKNDKQS
ncbi:MAG: ATP-grasp domain-containing protein [Syntrophales bacterium]|nr:ATP-grasp domain-containing protein [Syntrophales bacterium]